MKEFVGTKVESKKEWVAPELKKTSIEQITASGAAGTGEGASGKS